MARYNTAHHHVQGFHGIHSHEQYLRAVRSHAARYNTAHRRELNCYGVRPHNHGGRNKDNPPTYSYAANHYIQEYLHANNRCGLHRHAQANRHADLCRYRQDGLVLPRTSWHGHYAICFHVVHCHMARRNAAGCRVIDPRGLYPHGECSRVGSCHKVHPHVLCLDGWHLHEVYFHVDSSHRDYPHEIDRRVIDPHESHHYEVCSHAGRYHKVHRSVGDYYEIDPNVVHSHAGRCYKAHLHADGHREADRHGPRPHGRYLHGACRHGQYDPSTRFPPIYRDAPYHCVQPGQHDPHALGLCNPRVLLHVFFAR